MDKEYRKELTSEEKLPSILRYVGQDYHSSTGGGVLTLSVLDAYHKADFDDDFSVVLKSLDNITEEDAMEVFKITLGTRRKMIEMQENIIRTLGATDNPKYIETAKEAKLNMPKVEIYEKQFHVRGDKMTGSLDFWHGHKSLKELHFGFETENPSSYVEYSPMNPHMVIQYLESKGYMIPYNGVDLFDDGIATRKTI